MTHSRLSDGKRIVTASHDKTARLWDAETGKPIGEIKGHEHIVMSAAFSPDGKRVVTASFDKTARLWDILPTTQELVSHAKAAVPRCLIPAQRNWFFLPPEPPLWCIQLEKWPYDTTVWKQWLSDFRAGKSRPPPPPSSSYASDCAGVTCVRAPTGYRIAAAAERQRLSGLG